MTKKQFQNIIEKKIGWFWIGMLINLFLIFGVIVLAIDLDKYLHPLV